MHGEGRGERSLEDETDLRRGASSFFFPNSFEKKNSLILPWAKTLPDFKHHMSSELQVLWPHADRQFKARLGYEMPPSGSCVDCSVPNLWRYLGRWWELWEEVDHWGSSFEDCTWYLCLFSLLSIHCDMTSFILRPVPGSGQPYCLIIFTEE